MSLLTTVQKFCRRTSVPVPGAVLGSTDPQVMQIYSLLEEGLEELVNRGAWEELTYEALWTSLAQEDQGDLDTLAPRNFGWILAKSLWDRTQMLPLLGATSTRDWQYIKAVNITGPRYNFRVRNHHFLVNPAPPAGHTWVFEYSSLNFAQNVPNGVYLDTFDDDANEILIPEVIALADLRWRWKKEKGLAYAEDFARAERMIENALARSKGPSVVSLDCEPTSARPGIAVPIGSWNL